MLTKPVHGWSRFQLANTGVYRLSDLDDLAFAWTEQAIQGLETLLPFCVKGFMEPGRFLCLVSYWNCHIVCEDDERQPLAAADMQSECSHTSMLQFCTYLYEDIQKSLEEWAAFSAGGADGVLLQRKEQLAQKLARLQALIAERRECFGEDRCFL